MQVNSTPQIKFLTTNQTELLLSLARLRLTELVLSVDNPAMIELYQETIARLES